MATKTTFDFNSENITNGFQKVFNTIQGSKVTVSSDSGKQWISIPLIFALVIGIIFPFLIVITIALILFRVIKVSVVRDIQENIDKKKVIEIK